jgi:hypothetical protein
MSCLPKFQAIDLRANPLLTDDQLADVAAYIMTLREDRTKEP